MLVLVVLVLGWKVVGGWDCNWEVWIGLIRGQCRSGLTERDGGELLQRRRNWETNSIVNNPFHGDENS